MFDTIRLYSEEHNTQDHDRFLKIGLSQFYIAIFISQHNTGVYCDFKN